MKRKKRTEESKNETKKQITKCQDGQGIEERKAEMNNDEKKENKEMPTEKY